MPSLAFRQNELAYLALTSKIELAIRDRIAFYCNLHGKNITVAREWHSPAHGKNQRTDIAIFCKSPLLALIEIKAIYTLDAFFNPKSRDYFLNIIRNDQSKSASVATNLVSAQKVSVQTYELLLAVHPHVTLGTSLNPIIKYISQINKCINRHGDKYFNKAQTKIRNILSSASLNYEEGIIKGGCAFGVDVDVIWWLIYHPNHLNGQVRKTNQL